MEKIKEIDDECSDDDIFLSPGKRRTKQSDSSAGCAVHTQGIYEEMVRKMKSCLNGIPKPPVDPLSVYFKMEDVEMFISSARLQQINDGDLLKNKENNGTVRRQYGVYHNLDHSCEEFERLGALYVEKYLQCETMSTMSDLTTFNYLTASAKKRRRCNGWATSPGSRLSYLARRKSTFSVDQVSKLGQPASSKQFLIQRDQLIKGVKSVPLKPKRALFQSPDENKKSDPYRTPDANKRRQIRRKLSMPSPHSTRSRRNQSSPEKKKPRSCRKSLEFTEDIARPMNLRKNESSSDNHVKRKLLWAVSTALKGVSVTSNHSKFKTCMNKLFKASLAKWNEEKHLDRRSQQQISTSEAMLAMAKSLLESVIIPELPSSVETLAMTESTSNRQPLVKHDTNNQKVDEETNVTSLATGEERIRILSELTNSDVSVKTEDDGNSGLSSKSHFPEPSSLHSPVRNSNKSPQNSGRKLRSSNHKRKRGDLEEEEEGNDNRPNCKSAKLVHHCSSAHNKFATSGS